MSEIRAHEFTDGVCKWCGAQEPGTNCNCLLRNSGVPSDLRPEPARRVMAADDDSIAGRIAELRAERAAAMNETTIEEITE